MIRRFIYIFFKLYFSLLPLRSEEHSSKRYYVFLEGSGNTTYNIRSGQNVVYFHQPLCVLSFNVRPFKTVRCTTCFARFSPNTADRPPVKVHTASSELGACQMNRHKHRSTLPYSWRDLTQSLFFGLWGLPRTKHHIGR